MFPTMDTKLKPQKQKTLNHGIQIPKEAVEITKLGNKQMELTGTPGQITSVLGVSIINLQIHIYIALWISSPT